jgi:hypothetical protein
MLCNDREVLGPWVNPPWLKAFASIVVGVLIVLSGILTITTIFPSVDVTTLALVGGCVLVAVLVPAGLFALRSRRGASAVTFVGPQANVPREQWTMPPATLLSRPQWSAPKRAAMLVLGSYMVVALVMLVVKSVQLAGG